MSTSLNPVSVQPTSDQQPAGSQQPASNQLPTCVQLQLFLVRPDAVTKDARVVEVTLENHSACMALFKESEMFDYWSLIRAYRTKIKKGNKWVKGSKSGHNIATLFRTGDFKPTMQRDWVCDWYILQLTHLRDKSLRTVPDNIHNPKSTDVLVTNSLVPSPTPSFSSLLSTVLSSDEKLGVGLGTRLGYQPFPKLVDKSLLGS